MNRDELEQLDKENLITIILKLRETVARQAVQIEVSEKKKQVVRRRWRLFRRLALAVVLVLIGVQTLQLLIPALQYRDDVLRLLHYSDDCHAPCFMDITPGQTTKEEVFTILDNHPDVTRYDEFWGGVSVYWRGYDSLNITWEDNVVDRIGFVDHIPLVAFCRSARIS